MNLTKKKKIKRPFEPNLSFQIVSVDATKDAIRLKATIREQRVSGSLRNAKDESQTSFDLSLSGHIVM